MARDYLFTSESVTEGHPDKIADQISDSILDAILAQDPASRVACETFLNTGFAIIGGEVTTNAVVDYPHVIRKTIKGIGYDTPDAGFNGETCAVLVSLDKQSPDIAQGVVTDLGVVKEQGAGDQGMMFGYACDETEHLMPMPIYYSHLLARKLAKIRKDNLLDFLGPDGKSQVTVRYENGKACAITTIVISTQHSESVAMKAVREGVIEEVIKKVIPSELMDDKVKFLINPTGRFVIGGPMGDSGLTGRKIVVDTYGGMGRHGGGAFSGKDPSKVDRSGAYMTRYIAKNLVAAGLASRCEVQIAYAIGVAEPVSIMVETFGTGKMADQKISDLVREHFRLKPAAIIENFDLKRPIYQQTAAYGHFGRPEFPWEKLDMVEALR